MTHRSRTVLSVAIAGTVVASMLALVPGVASSAVPAPLRHLASGPLPSVTQIPPHSGNHGYPYDAVPTTPYFPGAPVIHLAHYGYAQREFLMSGTTNIYQQSGFWGSDGDWNVSVAQSNVPYTTRLLVRYPTNPKKFNGTVVVEWLNETTGGDQDPVWSEIYREVLAKGYAYVGVSAQTGSMVEDKTWDPPRYGALGDSNDGQSYDIFTQAAEVARADAGNLLGGLHPTTVIGTGDSQSAFRLVTYVNAIQPLSHAFNGFLAVGRGALAAPIGSGLVGFSPFPALIRTDNTTPFIQLETEGDIEELGAAYSRQPDNSDLRTWELAGAAHIDLHEGLYEGATLAREAPQLTPRSAYWRALQRGDPAGQHGRLRTRGRGAVRAAEVDHQGGAGTVREPDRDHAVLQHRRTRPVRERAGRDPAAGHPGADRDLLCDQLLPAEPGEPEPEPALQPAAEHLHHPIHGSDHQPDAAHRGPVPAGGLLHAVQHLAVAVPVPDARRLRGGVHDGRQERRGGRFPHSRRLPGGGGGRAEGTYPLSGALCPVLAGSYRRPGIRRRRYPAE